MLASTGETGVLVHGWWDCKLVQPLWKTVWKFLKKLKIELPYDPVIPLLGIYPKEIKTLTWKNSCTPLFIAALFTIAKTQKQLSVYWWMTGWRKCGIITQWNTIQPLKKKKKTRKYHYSPIRMAKMKHSDKTNFWQGCRDARSLKDCW